MRKITHNVHTKTFYPESRALSWAIKVESTGEWTLAYNPETCRTYMSCYLWHTTGHADYDLSLYLFKSDKAPKLSDDYSAIFFTAKANKTYSYDISLKEMVEIVEQNIPFLNEIEDKYGLEKTVYEVIDDPTGLMGVVFIGDATWHSNLWKNTLYTYLLKQLTFKGFLEKEDDIYYAELKKKNNFHKLLTKVKTFFDEELVNEEFNGVHNLSGFYTICQGLYNPVMTKLLLGDK